MNSKKTYCSCYCDNAKCKIRIDYEEFLAYVNAKNESKLKMKNKRGTKECIGYIEP